MKGRIYTVFIICLAVVSVVITNYLISKKYIINDHVIETKQFRQMEIPPEFIENAKILEEERNIEFLDLITANFLFSNLKIDREKISAKKSKRIIHGYKSSELTKYNKVKTAVSAIFNDIKYFPVAKGKESEYWVNFEQSFGAKRNYNGQYVHEGTDIMAENNVSGYYPIVSVTDGVIENMGWLEKGGYRIGIRSTSGGYFYYAHLSSYAHVKKGDKIKAGTLLGYMGDTGYGKAEGTSGNFDVHLHFGIYIKTDNYEELSVNPYCILKYLEDKLIIANY